MPCCTGQVNNIKEAERLAGLLNDDACNSLLKKHLTKDKLDALKKKKTKLGGHLAHCIVSGCLNIDSNVGIYACDPEAYTTFSDLFDPIIKDYHKTDVLNHPKPHFGADELKCGDLDKSGDRIVSTRVRVARSHNGFPFPPLLTVEKRLQMERMTVAALNLLKGELAGTYYPLSGMSKEEEEKLVKDHFLFNDSNRFLNAAGAYRNWPSGRGIFLNKSKTFLTWVNEEDHLRIISMQPGGNLQEVYSRLVNALNSLDATGIKFALKEGIGHGSTWPPALGAVWKNSSAEAERLFRMLNVIKAYFGLKAIEHPLQPNFGISDEWFVNLPKTLNPSGHYILQSRVLLKRNLDGLPFQNLLNAKQRYLTFCPSNLGTGMRVSFHMKIPLLAQQPNFEALCKSLGLQARGVDGEHTESKDGVYDISNIQRLGKTELDIIRDLAKAVKELIDKEQKLEKDAKEAAEAEAAEKAETPEKTSG